VNSSPWKPLLILLLLALLAPAGHT